MACWIGFLENLDGSLKISLNSSANSGGKFVRSGSSYR